jgi:hypothetical protein
MKSMLRMSFFGAMIALVVGLLAGCHFEATIESMTRFEGNDVNMSGAYTSGQNIRVESLNGSIRLRPGSSATEVTVTFMPFTMRPDDEEEQAWAEIHDDLRLTVDDSSGTILIKASRASGSNDYLGAEVRVDLPAGFDGGIEVEQDNGQVDADLTGGSPAYTTIFGGNGSLDIVGAGGQLDIFCDNGDIDLTVQSWAVDSGSVEIDGPGDITFGVAAGLSGRITAQAADPDDDKALVTGPNSGDWVETETAPNDKSYDFGADPAAGGLVTLKTSFFTSSIEISQR